MNNLRAFVYFTLISKLDKYTNNIFFNNFTKTLKLHIYINIYRIQYNLK